MTTPLPSTQAPAPLFAGIKAVLVACMRKLLTILNAMLRERLSWHELQLVKTLDN